MIGNRYGRRDGWRKLKLPENILIWERTLRRRTSGSIGKQARQIQPHDGGIALGVAVMACLGGRLISAFAPLPAAFIGLILGVGVFGLYHSAVVLPDATPQDRKHKRIGTILAAAFVASGVLFLAWLAAAAAKDAVTDADDCRALQQLILGGSVASELPRPPVFASVHTPAEAREIFGTLECRFVRSERPLSFLSGLLR